MNRIYLLLFVFFFISTDQTASAKDNEPLAYATLPVSFQSFTSAMSTLCGKVDQNKKNICNLDSSRHSKIALRLNLDYSVFRLGEKWNDQYMYDPKKDKMDIEIIAKAVNGNQTEFFINNAHVNKENIIKPMTLKQPTYISYYGECNYVFISQQLELCMFINDDKVENFEIREPGDGDDARSDMRHWMKAFSTSGVEYFGTSKIKDQ